LKLPITKLSQLTGVHRDSISKRLANLPFEAGKKGAKLYSSEDALAEIYEADSLHAARAEQARTAAELNAIRAENLRKTRIPIQIVCDVIDEVFQAIATTLKAEAARFTSRTCNAFARAIERLDREVDAIKKKLTASCTKSADPLPDVGSTPLLRSPTA
jgi:hypothetical protein